MTVSWYAWPVWTAPTTTGSATWGDQGSNSYMYAFDTDLDTVGVLEIPADSSGGFTTTMASQDVPNPGAVSASRCRVVWESAYNYDREVFHTLDGAGFTVAPTGDSGYPESVRDTGTNLTTAYANKVLSYGAYPWREWVDDGYGGGWERDLPCSAQSLGMRGIFLEVTWSDVLSITLNKTTTSIVNGVSTDTLVATVSGGSSTVTWTKISGTGTITPSGTSCVVSGAGSASTMVVRAACTADTTKYVQCTVTITSPTVNTPTGSTSVEASSSAVYSATITSDPQNRGTWSIISGGGSLSGAVNDATSSRVTWTAPAASGGTAVLRCTSSLDSSRYAQITVTKPTISLAWNWGYWGPTVPVAAGFLGTWGVIITNHSNHDGTWSCSGGTLVTKYNDVNGSYHTWTAPTTPGKYTITYTHAVDTSKTATCTVYVDYVIPTTTTFTLSTPDTGGVTDAAAAYDENAGTAASGDMWVGGTPNGGSFGDWNIYGFPSMSGCYTVTATITYNNNGSFAEGMSWSPNGGVTWIYLAGVGEMALGAGTLVVDLTTPQGSMNTSNIRLRFGISSTWESDWDGYQWNMTYSSASSLAIYEINLKVKTRGYGALTSFTAPTSTVSRILFPANHWLMGSGTISPPTTTDAALFSTENGGIPYTFSGVRYKYFDGAS